MAKSARFFIERNLMRNSINSKIYLWSGIFSGIMAVILFILLRPGINNKQLLKPANSKYIDLSNEDITTQEVVRNSRKSTPKSKMKDDLKVIKGIGPKIEILLNENGISSFEDLSLAKIDDLTAILYKNNIRLANPEFWPEDAKRRIN